MAFSKLLLQRNIQIRLFQTELVYTVFINTAYIYALGQQGGIGKIKTHSERGRICDIFDMRLTW